MKQQFQSGIGNFHGIYHVWITNEIDSEQFYRNYSKPISVPGTQHQLFYDPLPRLAVATSQLGASKAIMLGAYAFAIKELERSWYLGFDLSYLLLNQH